MHAGCLQTEYHLLQNYRGLNVRCCFRQWTLTGKVLPPSSRQDAYHVFHEWFRSPGVLNTTVDMDTHPDTSKPQLGWELELHEAMSTISHLESFRKTRAKVEREALLSPRYRTRGSPFDANSPHKLMHELVEYSVLLPLRNQQSRLELAPD